MDGRREGEGAPQGAEPRPLEPGGSERRAHTRRHIDPRLAVHASLREGEVDAVVRDLSLLGVLVEVPSAQVEALPGLNAEVQVALRLGDGPPLACEARVAWLGGSHRHGQRHYRAGLAFEAVSPMERDRLAAFIDALPG